MLINTLEPGSSNSSDFRGCWGARERPEADSGLINRTSEWQSRSLQGAWFTERKLGNAAARQLPLVGDYVSHEVYMLGLLSLVLHVDMNSLDQAACQMRSQCYSTLAVTGATAVRTLQG